MATSTGATLPGTGENNAGIGATAWSNPGNIVSDNTTDATCNAAASSQYLVARNFGFTVPSTATITGVTVIVEASEHSGGTEDLNARLQDGSAALFGSTKTQNLSGTGKAVYTYGSTSDVWGATLTPAIVNDADFGVRFWFTTAHDVRIDYVTVNIQYTDNKNTTPDVGAATLAGLAPTVVATANRNTTADFGTLLLTGFEPAILTPRNVTPDVGALALAGFAPTVQTPVNLLPDFGALVLAGFAPTVAVGGPPGNIVPISGAVGIDTTAAIDTTGANFIVLTTGGDPSRTPSDSKSNTWVPLTEYKNGADTAEQLWYCFNPTVGTGHTFSVNQSYAFIGAAAFSGVDTSPFDVENGSSTAADTSLQGGAVTPSQNNSLVISAICTGNDNTGLGVDLSFNVVGTEDGVVFVNYGGGLAYKIQTTATSEDPTWSWSGTSTASIGNATFKAAPAANINVTPGTGALVLTGLEPTVQTPRNITPDTGALVLDGFAPAVQTPVNVTPYTGVVLINGFAPIVEAPRNILVDVGVIIIIGQTPTVTATDNITVNSDTGLLVVTGFAPFVNVSVSTSPDTGVILFTGFEPQVTTSAGAQPETGVLELTAFAPIINVTQSVFPQTGSLQITGFAPVLETPRNITTGVGSLLLTGFVPIVTISSSTPPSTLRLGELRNPSGYSSAVIDPNNPRHGELKDHISNYVIPIIPQNPRKGELN